MAQSAYVVAIGGNGIAAGYLLDGKSKQRLEKFTRIIVDKLQFAVGPRGTITRGKIVKMPFTSLRKEIDGFEWYAEPCLSMRGIATAERLGNGKWNFTCEMGDGTSVQHAAPIVRRKSHALVRENPVNDKVYEIEDGVVEVPAQYEREVINILKANHIGDPDPGHTRTISFFGVTPQNIRPILTLLQAAGFERGQLKRTDLGIVIVPKEQRHRAR